MRDDGLLFELAGIRPARIAAQLEQGERVLHETSNTAVILLPHIFPRCGKKTLQAHGCRTAHPDETLIAALRKAHAMLTTKRGMPIMHAAPASPYDRMILRLAFLAPDIQHDILRGRQPPGFNLETFRKIDVPLAWAKQRKALGWEQTKLPCSAELQA